MFSFLAISSAESKSAFGLKLTRVGFITSSVAVSVVVELDGFGVEAIVLVLDEVQAAIRKIKLNRIEMKNTVFFGMDKETKIILFEFAVNERFLGLIIG